MGRRAGGGSGKKEEILSAAQSCFLEHGFDGTSVRSIMKKAGGEIGLFYYYFQGKEEIFDRVLDRFFLPVIRRRPRALSIAGGVIPAG